MTDTRSTIPQQVSTARRPEQIREALAILQEWPNLDAIPHLCRLQRRLPGWVFAVVSWLSIAALALLVTCTIMVFWIMLWWGGAEQLASLVETLQPGWGWRAVALTLALTFASLYADKRFRALVAQWLTREMASMPVPLRVIAETYRNMGYAILILIVGSALAIIWSVAVTALLDQMVWLTSPATPLSQLSVYVGVQWPSLIIVLLAAGAGVLLLRALWRGFVPLSLAGMIGFWGTHRLAQAAAAFSPSHSAPIAEIVIIAVVCYLIKISFLVGRSAVLPFHWVVDSTGRLAIRAGLRRQVAAAIRHYRERNRERVGKDWRQAICAKCLSRLEWRQERLAYLGRLLYYRCPVCHTDSACFRGVQQLEGWLDGNASATPVQVDDTVRVNLLAHVAAPDQPLPPALDMVVVGDCTDHQVEAFLTQYTDRGLKQRVRPLATLPYRIEPDSPVGPGVRAMLQGSMARGRGNHAGSSS